MDQQDDQVLKKLLKEDANETPSKQLDEKILAQAKNKKVTKQGSSHFSGGWKVPLSLAASITLVLAILIQLERSPESLEKAKLPVPNISTKQSAPKDFSDSTYGTDLKDETVSPSSITTEQNQHLESLPQTGLEQKKRDLEQRSIDLEIAPPEKLQQEFQEKSASPAERKRLEEDIDLVHLPIEDWLQRIEQLIANKDYAEAARELRRLKLVHPYEDVTEIESKIP